MCGLPNGLGGSGLEAVPPIIHGSVLLSAAEVEGGLWPSPEMKPYRSFQSVEPDEEIDYGVLVYRGDVRMEATGGPSRAFLSTEKRRANQPQEALALAEEAVKLSPGQLYPELARGEAAAALGKKDEARSAYQAAIVASQKLDPQRQAENTRVIEASIKRL